jgi:hypothetical protein
MKNVILNSDEMKRTISAPATPLGFPWKISRENHFLKPSIAIVILIVIGFTHLTL